MGEASHYRLGPQLLPPGWEARFGYLDLHIAIQAKNIAHFRQAGDSMTQASRDRLPEGILRNGKTSMCYQISADHINRQNTHISSTLS